MRARFWNVLLLIAVMLIVAATALPHGQAVTLTPTNTVLDSGQTEKLMASLSGGTGAFTVNFYNVSSGTTRNSLSTLAVGWSNSTPYFSNVPYKGVVGEPCVMDASNNIYCIGGDNNNTAFYAPTSSSGIGNWISTNSYPLLKWSNGGIVGGYMGCSLYSGYIYCIGGHFTAAGSVGTNDVYYAPVLAGGGIGAWSFTSNYPANVYDLSCPTYNGYIYCVGGASTVANSIYYASVSGSGIGTWAATTPYPDVMTSGAGTKHGAIDPKCVIYNGYIYCLGGLNVDTTSNVFYAQVSSSGVGSWSITSNYPVTIYDNTCAVSGNYLICSGGKVTGVASPYSGTYFTSLSSTGVSAWLPAANYILPFYSGGCATSNSFIYCVGGGKNGFPSVTTNTTYARVLSNGIISAPIVTNTFVVSSQTNGNTFTYNIIALDTGTSTTFNSIPNTITVNQKLGTPTLSTVGIADAGQTTTFTANLPPSQTGTSPYTYNYVLSGFLTTNELYKGVSSTTNTLVVTINSLVNAANVTASVKINDSASTASTANSVTSHTYVYTAPIASISSNNPSYTTGQQENINVIITNGAGPYSANFVYSNGIVANTVSNLGQIWTLDSNSYPGDIFLQSCTPQNGYIYCVGGENGFNSDSSNSVYYSKVQSDNSVGAWSITSNYPQQLQEMPCVSTSTDVYCIGGYNVFNFYDVNSVYYSPIQPDNSLGAWQTTNSYPMLINEQSCITSNNYVYCMAGVNQSTNFVSFNDVYYSPILSDGSLGAWAATNSYPANVEGLSCVTSNSVVYCIGGDRYFSSDYGTNVVAYANVLGAGGLSAWTISPNYYPINMPFAPSCVTNTGYIYCAGGAYYGNSVKLNNAYYAKILGGGAGMGGWNATTSYPILGVDSGGLDSTATHPCVASGSYDYCVGNDATNVIYHAKMSSYGIADLANYTFTTSQSSYTFNAVVTDTGTTSPFVFSSPSNTISSGSSPSGPLTATPNPTSITNATIPIGKTSYANTVISGGTGSYKGEWTWVSTNTTEQYLGKINLLPSEPEDGALNPAGTMLYVPNYAGAGVSIINTATNTLANTILIGDYNEPFGIAFDPTGSFAYLTNSLGAISVIDTSTNTIVKTIPNACGSSHIIMNPAGTYAYCIDGSTMNVISLSTNAVTGIIPLPGGANNYFAINPSGTLLYAVTSGSNTVEVLDLSTNKLVNHIQIDGIGTTVAGNTGGVAFNPAGTLAYVTSWYTGTKNYGSANVVVIDVASNSIVNTINLGAAGYTGDIAINPAGTMLYVPLNNNGTVEVMDLATNTVVKNIPTGVINPWQIVINSAGTVGYVIGGAYGMNGTVAVMNLVTNSVAYTFPTQILGADDVVFGPSGQYAYVTSNGNDTRTGASYKSPGILNILDASSNTIAHQVFVSNNPEGVAINPAGTLAYVMSNPTSTPSAASTISVVDLGTSTVIATISTVVQGIHVEFTPNGNLAYASNGVRTDVINVATNSVINSISTGGAVAFTPDGTFGYTSDGTVINVAQNAIVNTISGFTGYYWGRSIAINPQGTFAYAVGGSGSTSYLKVVNLATNSIVNTIYAPALGGTTPWAIAISPSGVLGYITYGDNDSLGVVDLITNTPIGAPIAGQRGNIAFNPKGNYAYVVQLAGAFDNGGVMIVPAPETNVQSIPANGMLSLTVTATSSTSVGFNLGGTNYVDVPSLSPHTTFGKYFIYGSVQDTGTNALVIQTTCNLTIVSTGSVQSCGTTTTTTTTSTTTTTTTSTTATTTTVPVVSTGGGGGGTGGSCTPTVTQEPNSCVLITCFTNPQTVRFVINGQQFNITDNYITSNYTAVVVNNVCYILYPGIPQTLVSMTLGGNSTASPYCAPVSSTQTTTSATTSVTYTTTTSSSTTSTTSSSTTSTTSTVYTTSSTTLTTTSTSIPPTSSSSTTSSTTILSVSTTSIPYSYFTLTADNSSKTPAYIPDVSPFKACATIESPNGTVNPPLCVNTSRGGVTIPMLPGSKLTYLCATSYGKPGSWVEWYQWVGSTLNPGGTYARWFNSSALVPGSNITTQTGSTVMFQSTLVSFTAYIQTETSCWFGLEGICIFYNTVPKPATNPNATIANCPPTANGGTTVSTTIPATASTTIPVTGQSTVSTTAQTTVPTTPQTTVTPTTTITQKVFTTGNYLYCVSPINDSALTFYSTLSNNGISNWTQTTSMPQFKNDGGLECFSSGTYLYCMNEGIYGSNTLGNPVSFYTNLTTTGVAGWSSTTPYPTNATLQSCIVQNGYVYCVGGFSNTNAACNNCVDSPKVYYANLSGTGIGSWVRTTKYPRNVTDTTCSTSNGYIYCVGGLMDPLVGSEPGIISSLAYYAPISSSGVGAWVRTTNYPLNVSLAQCGINDSYIYCTTGQKFSVSYSASYYAPISSSGIGQWLPTTRYPVTLESATNLTSKYYDPTCYVMFGYIYCSESPLNKASNVSSYYAPLSKAGIGKWMPTAPSYYPIYYSPGNPGFRACTPATGKSAITVTTTIPSTTSSTSIATTTSVATTTSSPTTSTILTTSTPTTSLATTTIQQKTYNPMGPNFVAFTPSGNAAYVTDLYSNTVSIIDVQTNTVTGYIPVGLSPGGIAVNPQGNLAYSVNFGSGNVSVIDTATNKVIKSINVGTNPSSVAFSPSGKVAYVPNRGSGTVSVINVSTNTVTSSIGVGSAPDFVAFDPSGAIAYVTSGLNSNVIVIDVSTGSVLKKTYVPYGNLGAEPEGVAFSPSGSFAYVADMYSSQFSVISTSTDTVTKTISLYPPTTHSEFVAFNPSGTLAYLTGGGFFGNVTVVNAATDAIEYNIPVGKYPAGLAFHPSGSFAYVTNEESNTISVIEVATGKLARTIQIQ
ncbi:MAG: beta-propeller fold lactonase family protein [Candidatus Micrarchaeota archaeon]|nr:beta-propeller fold lactonase family protein [Candidatus Micrarchaeota archaeon]